MHLDRSVFRQQFDIFKERVRQKSKHPFVSFHEGLPLEWEGYKEPVRQKALARLNATTWQHRHRERRHPQTPNFIDRDTARG